MQTIYKANHTSRFNFVGSDFCNAKIPSDAKNVLLYLIDKPLDWKLIVKNIANTLDLSVYAVRKALRWLLDNGYARYKRFTDGRTVWEIFEQPNQAATQVMTPRVEIPHVEIEHVLHKTQTLPITQKTTTPIEQAQAQQEQLPVEKPSVVVHCNEMADNHPISTPTQTIDDVPHIAPQHQPAAKRALSRLTQEQAQAVLTAFTFQASKSNISNKVGYLIGLVKASKDGTFSPVQLTQSPATLSLYERIVKEQKSQQEAQKRGRMTNEEHADWLERTYGVKQSAKSSSTSISSRLAGVMLRAKRLSHKV